MDKSPAYMH